MRKPSPRPASPKPRILLGVTGSAAAYKAAALLRLLRARYEVRVVATRAASRLVRIPDLARAADSPVGTDAFRGVKPVPVSTPPGSHPLLPVPHIEFARECDLLLIAPATADFLAKMALGLADDLLSSCCLYSKAPAMVAPAMNQAMWGHPAVESNVRTLLGRGVILVEPGTGHLACGDEGKGRMAEPAEILREVDRFFDRRGRWEGLEVCVTAGPTQEPLDPVRVLTNHSSGRMGYAIAEAARLRGARVTLVTGPTALPPPGGVRLVRVRTALDMRRAVMAELPTTDLLVMAAAVADFRPVHRAGDKIKKTGASPLLRLERNPDILAEALRRRGKGTRVVGFAAETRDLERQARTKWARKPCDMLVANLVGEPAVDGRGTGVGADENEVTVFLRGRRDPLRLARDRKTRLADRLLDLMEDAWRLSSRRKRGGRR
jgi:phosphopantothenoylcysteine decarboxylase/phosphopantothenate--cysteine ligase